MGKALREVKFEDNADIFLQKNSCKPDDKPKKGDDDYEDEFEYWVGVINRKINAKCRFESKVQVLDRRLRVFIK